MSQFYALMPDNTVKHIPLKEEIPIGGIKL